VEDEMSVMDNDDISHFWRQQREALVVDGIKTAQSAAYQIVSAVAVLQGMYVAAISLSELPARLGPGRAGLLWIPIGLWCVCIACAIRAHMPGRLDYLNYWDQTRDAVHATYRRQHRWLRGAYAALLTGMAALALCVGMYLMWSAGATPTNSTP
jgi:hypothetical protein